MMKPGKREVQAGNEDMGAKPVGTGLHKMWPLREFGLWRHRGGGASSRVSPEAGHELV